MTEPTKRAQVTCNQSSPFLPSGVLGQSNAEKINKVLFTIADAVNTTLNLDHLYKIIHKTLSTIIDATNFFIAIVDSKKKTIYFPYFVDSMDDDYPPIADFDTTSSLTGLVVLKKKALLLNRAQLEKREKVGGLQGSLPYTWLGVPLIIRDEVIGIIAAQSYSSEETYSQDDLKLLSAVSHQTAIAIDRKRSLDSLTIAKERHSFALQATGSGIWDWNIEKNIIFLDENHYLMAGYTPGEYSSTRAEWKKRVHPEDLPRIIALLEKTKSGTLNKYRSEYRYKRKSGEWMWILSQGKVVSWTTDKKPARFIGTHTDITRQKIAEEKLSLSEKTYRNIFLNAQIGLFRIRLSDLKFIECNDAIARMFGYVSREECLRNFSAPQAYVSAKSLRTTLRKLRKYGEIKDDVSQFYKKDRSFAWLRTSARIYPEKNYLEGVVEDITDFIAAQEEKRILQDKLEKSKKMEALGLLAGSVAHDLNNILSGIIGYPELMLLKLEKDSELVAPLRAIRDSGNRAATVVNDLLTIARSAASIKEVSCLNTIVLEYVSSPECVQFKAANPQIQIRTDLKAAKSSIYCSPVHVAKSLMNLVTNAVEAVDGSGSITISTKNCTARQSKGDLPPINQAALCVHDTGPGIDPKDINHIFEPFYTQKVMGKSGTGLGLTVVWNTMEDHNGTVSVESTSKGTTFTLVFPITEITASKQHESYDIQNFMGRGEHILIVDDEPQLRDIASRLLTSLGYNTAEVNSGESAIEYLKSNHADLVLLDMLMQPGLNGRETYEEIVKIRPRQKAIIASGFSESKEVNLALQRGVGSFVKKPYSIKQLSIAVKEQLATLK